MTKALVVIHLKNSFIFRQANVFSAKWHFNSCCNFTLIQISQFFFSPNSFLVQAFYRLILCLSAQLRFCLCLPKLLVWDSSFSLSCWILFLKTLKISRFPSSFFNTVNIGFCDQPPSGGSRSLNTGLVAIARVWI